MFGHKCFLRLGQLKDSSISGLYKDSYELLSCDYSFAKSTDQNGKTQTEVRGGTIKVCYPNVPQPEFMGWMLKSGKLENGAIQVNKLTIGSVEFVNGHCVGFRQHIDTIGGGTKTHMAISPEELRVNDMSFDNHW